MVLGLMGNGMGVGIEGVTTPRLILLTPIIEGRAGRPRVLGFLLRKLVNNGSECTVVLS